MNMKRYLSLVISLLFAPLALAQTDCTPRAGGGYSCYDYDLGAFTDINPKAGGGYQSYDYDTGSYSDTTPRAGGGYTPTIMERGHSRILHLGQVAAGQPTTMGQVPFAMRPRDLAEDTIPTTMERVSLAA